jgi:hypothetical protein
MKIKKPNLFIDYTESVGPAAASSLRAIHRSQFGSTLDTALRRLQDIPEQNRALYSGNVRHFFEAMEEVRGLWDLQREAINVPNSTPVRERPRRVPLWQTFLNEHPDEVQEIIQPGVSLVEEQRERQPFLYSEAVHARAAAAGISLREAQGRINAEQDLEARAREFEAMNAMRNSQVERPMQQIINNISQFVAEQDNTATQGLHEEDQP